MKGKKKTSTRQFIKYTIMDLNILENDILKKKNEKLRNIIERNLAFFDRVQIQKALAREFLFVLRFQSDKERRSGSSGEHFAEQTTSLQQTTNRVLKLLNEQGFNAKLSQKADIKIMLAVYFV